MRTRLSNSSIRAAIQYSIVPPTNNLIKINKLKFINKKKNLNNTGFLLIYHKQNVKMYSCPNVSTLMHVRAETDLFKIKYNKQLLRKKKKFNFKSDKI